MAERTPSQFLSMNEKPWRRSFWSLIVTQFQGAFSDNTLQYLIIFLVVGMGLPKEQRDLFVALVGALFALPFILFSMTGGYFADRFSKRSVMIGVKYFEIVVMLIATLGLLLRLLPLQLFAILLMGIHSAIFGPAKYGILPEILPEKRLSWGNGVLELRTFLAIITGTITGAFLGDVFRENQLWSGVSLIGLALFGLFVCLGITRVPPADLSKTFRFNFLEEFFSQMRLIRRDRVLFLAVLGNTYFWFLGALLRFNII